MLLLPGLGFHDPFMAVNYLLVGGMIDLVFSVVSKQTSKWWIIAGAAGLCWVLIPAFRLVMSNFFTMPLGAFRSGIAYPFMTHLLFGLAGGWVAAGLLGLLEKKKDTGGPSLS
jgi:predicted Na+-dependent transporter